MSAIDIHRTEFGVKPLCDALGVPRETYYRRLRPPKPRPVTTRALSPRALSPLERTAVLDVLRTERFVDRAPTEVFATLLDEGTYHCSTRTMYRILSENREVRERRDQLAHPAYKKPEQMATAPNQVWSWDITKLLGPVKWSYFYLYVVLDIFSRYVVGWMLARSERALLARRLIRECCVRHDVVPGQLVLHADRGSPMRSRTLAQMLVDLGVEASFSRPQVSNDNPFSEAHFKTLKYWPGFPDRFGSFEDANLLCRRFFPWYNDEHRHTGLVGLTPAQVHFGRAGEVLKHRERVMRAAFERHPERFVGGAPRVAQLPAAVWINPPAWPDEHVIETPTETGILGDLNQGHPLNPKALVSHAR